MWAVLTADTSVTIQCAGCCADTGAHSRWHSSNSSAAAARTIISASSWPSASLSTLRGRLISYVIHAVSGFGSVTLWQKVLFFFFQEVKLRLEIWVKSRS